MRLCQPTGEAHTLDLSSAYRHLRYGFAERGPDRGPSGVTRLANNCIDQTQRRVQLVEVLLVAFGELAVVAQASFEG